MVFRSGLQPMIADFAPPTTANRRFNTLVLGLGKTGLSCVRHLAKQGETVAVADDSDAPPALEALREQHPEAPVFLGESFDEALLRRAGRVVVSPGVPGSHPAIWNAKALGLEVIGDVELFCRNAPGAPHRRHRLQWQKHGGQPVGGHVPARRTAGRSGAETSARRR